MKVNDLFLTEKIFNRDNRHHRASFGLAQCILSFTHQIETNFKVAILKISPILQ